MKTLSDPVLLQAGLFPRGTPLISTVSTPLAPSPSTFGKHIQTTRLFKWTANVSHNFPNTFVLHKKALEPYTPQVGTRFLMVYSLVDLIQVEVGQGSTGKEPLCPLHSYLAVLLLHIFSTSNSNFLS